MSDEQRRFDVSQVAPTAPPGDEITAYDQQHFLTYARLLDAERAGTPWQEIARDILRIQSDAAVSERERQDCYESHLARARWLVSTSGLGHLEQGPARERPRIAQDGGG